MFLGYIYQLCWRRTAIIGGLMSITISQVTASQVKEVSSQPTQPLVGHKPTVSEIVFDPANPRVGDNVTVSWTYFDADNDLEADSWVTWLVAGKEVKKGKEKSYTLPKDSGDKTLQVAVQPISAEKAFPREGDTAYSFGTTIEMKLCKEGTYGKVQNLEAWKIYCPIVKEPVTYTVAKENCERQAINMGKKSGLLPLRNHMLIFAQDNNDLCTKLGWPMRGKCGGPDVEEANFYWGRSDVKIDDRYVDVKNLKAYTESILTTRKALYTCWIS